MATSSQVREWWAGYQHNKARMIRTPFPATADFGGVVDLLVADQSIGIWQAVAQIMASTPYLFRESAGGTYSQREPGSTSLHTYALALDLNPSKNPMRPPPLVYDYPAAFIERMEGIRANGKQAITWGGRWPSSNPPDTMHWQMNVAPADCDEITWDSGNGGQMSWKRPGDEIHNVTDADAALAYQGTLAPGTGQASYNPANDAEANDRVWTVLGRVADLFMQIDQRLRDKGI